MTISHALEIINNHGVEFEVHDPGFGDNNRNIQHATVFNNEREARSYIKALQTVLNYMEGME